VIGERERSVPERGCSPHELVGLGRAIKKRKRRVGVQFHVARHVAGECHQSHSIEHTFDRRDWLIRSGDTQDSQAGRV